MRIHTNFTSPEEGLCGTWLGHSLIPDNIPYSCDFLIRNFKALSARKCIFDIFVSNIIRVAGNKTCYLGLLTSKMISEGKLCSKITS